VRPRFGGAFVTPRYTPDRRDQTAPRGTKRDERCHGSTDWTRAKLDSTGGGGPAWALNSHSDRDAPEPHVDEGGHPIDLDQADVGISVALALELLRSLAAFDRAALRGLACDW